MVDPHFFLPAFLMFSFTGWHYLRCSLSSWHVAICNFEDRFVSAVLIPVWDAFTWIGECASTWHKLVNKILWFNTHSHITLVWVVYYFHSHFHPNLICHKEVGGSSPRDWGQNPGSSRLVSINNSKLIEMVKNIGEVSYWHTNIKTYFEENFIENKLTRFIKQICIMRLQWHGFHVQS